MGRDARPILDRLGLVQDHAVELDVLQKRGVVPERPVGREDEVRPLESAPISSSPGPHLLDHPELGREARRLGPPVEEERPRHDDERRLRLLDPSGFEVGQELDSLP